MSKIKRILRSERGSFASDNIFLIGMTILSVMVILFLMVNILIQDPIPYEINRQSFATTELGQDRAIEIISFDKDRAVEITQSNHVESTPYVKTDANALEFISPIDNQKYTAVYSRGIPKSQTTLKETDTGIARIINIVKDLREQNTNKQEIITITDSAGKSIEMTH